MIAFKIIMILCSALSFMGSMVEKEIVKQKMYLAIFATAGVLYLLAEAVTKIIR